MSWASDIIDSLASLPGFPPDREATARDLLARRLEHIFGCPKQMPVAARALLDEMLELDRWPGPGTFFAIARRLARPAVDVNYNSADIPHLRDYLPKSDGLPDCEQCNKLGYRVLATIGYARCTCLAGQRLAQAFLDLLNSRTDKQRGAVRLEPVRTRSLLHWEAQYQPITAADIADAVHLRQMQKALNDPEFSTGGNI